MECLRHGNVKIYRIGFLVTASQPYRNSTERDIMDLCHAEHPVHS